MLMQKIEDIIEYQVENGLSTEQVCARIGISRMTLNNLMKQATKPQPKTLELIDLFLDKAREFHGIPIKQR